MYTQGSKDAAFARRQGTGEGERCEIKFASSSSLRPVMHDSSGSVRRCGAEVLVDGILAIASLTHRTSLGKETDEIERSSEALKLPWGCIAHRVASRAVYLRLLAWVCLLVVPLCTFRMAPACLLRPASWGFVLRAYPLWFGSPALALAKSFRGRAEGHLLRAQSPAIPRPTCVATLLPPIPSTLIGALGWVLICGGGGAFCALMGRLWVQKATA